MNIAVPTAIPPSLNKFVLRFTWKTSRKLPLLYVGQFLQTNWHSAWKCNSLLILVLISIKFCVCLNTLKIYFRLIFWMEMPWILARRYSEKILILFCTLEFCQFYVYLIFYNSIFSSAVRTVRGKDQELWRNWYLRGRLYNCDVGK